jgi:SAM-dependent methyltransferase
VAWDQLRSSYDRVAAIYETEFLAELDGKPFDRRLLHDFARAVGDPVVDIGCGPGQIGAFLRGCGHRVVGVDFSPQMARLAAGRLDGALAADMRALPFRSGQLGGLVAFYSLIHIPRPELDACLSELRRALRPGGRLLLSAHEGDQQVELPEFLGQPVPFVATFFALSELVAATVAAGFQVRSAERRVPYPSEHPTVRLYVEAER